MRRPIGPALRLLLASSLLAVGVAAAAAAHPSGSGTWVGRFWPGPSPDGSMPLPQVGMGAWFVLLGVSGGPCGSSHKQQQLPAQLPPHMCARTFPHTRSLALAPFA
jgi:hypothetical protein